MDAILKPYAVVRIRALTRVASDYDGWSGNIRSPRIGNIGTLVEVLSALESPNRYIVENSSPDGTTIWLGEFGEEELEVL